MTEKTLISFIKGELSAAKRSEVIRWIESSAENRKMFSEVKARQTVSQFNDAQFDVDKGFHEVNTQTLRSGVKTRTVLRIAAAVLLIVTTWFVWKMVPDSEKPTVVQDTVTFEESSATDRGENHEITLPDGSVVLLNADSRISWNSDFNNETREIQLVGEAFFDVVRHPGRPFIVHTGNMDVKVLGTRFNVRAYPDDFEPVTTLVSGSVEVTGEAKSAVTLRPLQTAVLDRQTDRFEIFDITEDEAAPWREGKLIFRDAPLEIVIRDIERKYDVECNVGALEMKDFKFTGTFDNLTIEEVLRVLKISSDIDYKINGEKIELF